jgi:IS605 OrfB family transposase
MITLKIKYLTSPEGAQLINEYRKQYSSVLRFAYNRLSDNITEKETEKILPSLSNTQLIKSYLNRCAVKNAAQLLKEKSDDKLIFGGKSNFLKRCQGKITHEEYKDRRLSKLYIIGEANQHGNRMIRINETLSSFTFKPNRNEYAVLDICGAYKRYTSILNRLYQMQRDKVISITYQLDDKYIYLTCDEKVLYDEYKNYEPIRNRVFAIDMNPNYIGYSVTDWKSSGEFTVISSGVISNKIINDLELSLKGYASESPERIYIHNKRVFESYEVSKLLVDTARHYRCELFCIEDLTMASNDKGKGKKYNRLVNNLWNRNKFVGNIRKRCNVYGIRVMDVIPQYSSFVGNFLYRRLNMPDMVLSSVEIGRRGYEFLRQYVRKEVAVKSNIMFPLVKDFEDFYAESVEEFGIGGGVRDFKGIYSELKNTGSRYRVSLDELPHLKFSRCFSDCSNVKKIYITLPYSS